AEIVAAFERLLNSGFLRLATVAGDAYFGTDDERESFFKNLFVAELTAEGVDYYESAQRQSGAQR
ncbi:MAG: hypothetical protein WCC25_12080, partial [Candidatus Korobacteraceae bacterium]